ncbi:hypothetical protein ABIB40_001511 [Pedobacter sp. UYP30]|uniref:hypothetical protein n=1 Tax=Pedobacter sp. UYP30 TaxID=1756400 RepID=UPI00339A9BA7
MVEVYSTNVNNQKQADFLLDQLGMRFPAYKINFDLEDCDNILRVESDLETIEVFQVIDLLNSLGFIAQVLPDILQSPKQSVPKNLSTT